MPKVSKDSPILLPLSALREHKTVMSRSCGECVACCVYYNIDEVSFKKKAFTPCQKLAEQPDMEEEPTKGRYTSTTDKNCTIHDSEEKPAVCNDFNCYWLLGNGDEEDRPDKIGIVIDRSKKIENAHEAKALWRGAEDTPEAIEMIERMSRDLGTPIIVLPFGELKIKRIVGRAAK